MIYRDIYGHRYDSFEVPVFVLTGGKYVWDRLRKRLVEHQSLLDYVDRHGLSFSPNEIGSAPNRWWLENGPGLPKREEVTHSPPSDLGGTPPPVGASGPYTTTITLTNDVLVSSTRGRIDIKLNGVKKLGVDFNIPARIGVNLIADRIRQAITQARIQGLAVSGSGADITLTYFPGVIDRWEMVYPS